MTAELESRRVAEHFAARVLRIAGLPLARRDDLRDSCEITADPAQLSITCTITGSTYERPWNGSEAEAMQLADEAADSTAYLLTKTPHYAYMRSAR